MSVLLDHFSLPDKGPVRVTLNRSFVINSTAEEAQRKVHLWLLNEVSCNIGAETPDLAIGQESVVWRVPAVYTAPHLGHVGVAGTVDVNVQTGEMFDLEVSKEAILAGASKLAAQMPTYVQRPEADEELVTLDIKPTHTEPSGDPLKIIEALD